MFIVYAIYNKKNDKIYIGQTQDLKQRLDLHNSGEFKNSYTSRFDGEWRLIYSEDVLSRNFAILRERQLKSHKGRDFIKTFIPR